MRIMETKQIKISEMGHSSIQGVLNDLDADEILITESMIAAVLIVFNSVGIRAIIEDRD